MGADRTEGKHADGNTFNNFDLNQNIYFKYMFGIHHPIFEENTPMKAVAVIIWIVLGATLAGIGLTIVVATPDLANQSMKYIPWAVLAGFVLAMPASVFLAAKLKQPGPGAQH